MKELRIIVAGSRDFKDYNFLKDKLMRLLETLDETSLVDNPSQVKFISGTAKGADVLGEQFAYTYGYEVKRFPAEWNLYGKSAGYIRNEQMAKYAVSEGCYGILIAFWDGKSKGTKHMVDLAKKYGLKIKVFKYKENNNET